MENDINFGNRKYTLEFSLTKLNKSYAYTCHMNQHSNSMYLAIIKQTINNMLTESLGCKCSQ